MRKIVAMAKDLGKESITIEQIQQIVRTNTINESTTSVRTNTSDTEETEENQENGVTRRNVSDLSEVDN